MARKATKTGRRDLSPKARKTREVIGGNFNDFKPTTQLPTETIRPGSVATKAGGEVISADAYLKAR
jgi:hypothetical protein